MLSKKVLKRIDVVEKKLDLRQPESEAKKQIDDSGLLLKSYAYLVRQQEMSMTPEEIQRDNEEILKQILEWYDRYCELSPEEQKRQNEIRDSETAKELEKFRVWFNSDERRQFDIKYAEFEAAQFDSANRRICPRGCPPLLLTIE